jgi:hypothetical protein
MIETKFPILSIKKDNGKIVKAMLIEDFLKIIHESKKQLMNGEGFLMPADYMKLVNHLEKLLLKVMKK